MLYFADGSNISDAEGTVAGESALRNAKLAALATIIPEAALAATPVWRDPGDRVGT